MLERVFEVTPKVLGEKLRDLLKIPGPLPQDLVRLVELLGEAGGHQDLALADPSRKDRGS